MRKDVRRQLLLIGLAACASGERTTWEDDRHDGVGVSERRSDPLPIPKKLDAVTIRPKTEVESIDYWEVARELEMELLRFVSQRRALSAEVSPAKEWPRPVTQLFADTLERLEKGFASPAGKLSARVAIQTRVTLEVELDLTSRRFGSPPKSITDRVTGLYTLVATHLHAAPRGEERPISRHDIRLEWPVTPVIVTSPFGFRRDPILGEEEIRFHSGVDLGGTSGDVVQAAAEGNVTYVGWLGGHGRTVVVQHHGGYMTMYSHLGQSLVKLGAHVAGGGAVGLVGSSGRSTGPHLHFEVRRGGTPIDPLDIVGAVIAEAGPGSAIVAAAAR
jgi:murein DD-endopeptidase MepM/ murein hydrolase activator NlpD